MNIIIFSEVVLKEFIEQECSLTVSLRSFILTLRRVSDWTLVDERSYETVPLPRFTKEGGFIDTRVEN